MGRILDKIMGRNPKVNHRVALGMIDVDPVLITENGKRLMREAMEANPELWSEDTEAHYAATGFPVGGHKTAEKQTFAAGEIPHASVDIDVTESFKAAAIENVGPARALMKVHKYEIATHIETAARMVVGLESQRSKLHAEGVADSEEFEKFKAEKEEEIRMRFEEMTAANARRAEEMDECNRLMRFYGSATELTAPGVKVGDTLHIAGRDFTVKPGKVERTNLIGEVLAQVNDPNSAWRKAHPNAIVSGGEKLSREDIARLPLSPGDLQRALDEFDAEQGSELGAIPRPKIRRRKPSTPATKET